MRQLFKLLGISAAVAVTISTAALAQWSIGQRGTREPPQGQNRYVYLVMADPQPGREFDFNDGYQNVHMGDLVQLPGWTGAQRFRLVPDVKPRNVQPLYRRGNLIIWDQEGNDPEKLRSDANAAIAGGKSRLIPGFDYGPDGAVRAYLPGHRGAYHSRRRHESRSFPIIPTTRPRGPTAISCWNSLSRSPVSARLPSKRPCRSASAKCWHCQAGWRPSRSAM